VDPVTIVAWETASPVTHSTTLRLIPDFLRYKVIKVVVTVTDDEVVFVVYPAELVVKVYVLNPLWLHV